MTPGLVIAVAALTAWCFLQRKHSLLRVYGPLALFRWVAEDLRPKLTQYLERPGDGRPYSLVVREWIYRASKNQPTTVGFGTTKDLHAPGTHTIRPAPFGITSSEMPDDSFAVSIGRNGRQFIARFPVMRSGGSFGAFGAMWTRAASDGGAILNMEYVGGAHGFLDNTGEGGLAPHHLSASPENQEYLDRLNERAKAAGHPYQFRFDRTATSDGNVITVPLDLKSGRIVNGRYEIAGDDNRLLRQYRSQDYGTSERPRHVIIQIGPALAGYRTPDGQIDWDWLNFICGLPDVAGIEIKSQQGAKPNDASLVKQAKLTAELRALRGFVGQADYRSPERLPFIRGDGGLLSQMVGLIHTFLLIQNLPNVKSRGLITGFKMTYCGHEFVRQLAGFLRGDMGPDYIIVDGAEGGTGAGDPMMTDHVGVHTYQGVARTHQILVEEGVRNKICLVGSGRIANPGHVATVLSLGADYCNAIRGYMMATGCIQARECHSNRCPTGITTHNAWRQRGLDPTLKSVRFANYGRALRDGTVKLARVAGVHLKAGERFTLRNIDVVTGVGQLTSGEEIYQIGNPIKTLKAAG